MERSTCKKCGSKTITLTEFHKACCAVEHLIDDRAICLNCMKETNITFVLFAGLVLMNPAKHGDDCPRKSPECSLGRLDEPYDLTSDDGYESQGPTDLRDDWPHAKPVPGGARL